jgi:hypothetical protein
MWRNQVETRFVQVRLRYPALAEGYTGISTALYAGQSHLPFIDRLTSRTVKGNTGAQVPYAENRRFTTDCADYIE